MTVVDASIVVRLLLNRRGDAPLRQRFERERQIHAPALIDAEVASAIRGLLLTTKDAIRITPERAQEMVEDYGDLPIVRHPMQPLHPRVLGLRDNLTAYDAFYVVLAAMFDMPLLTDDGKFSRTPGLPAVIETWPDPEPLPDAVLVGGSAAAYYAGHRESSTMTTCSPTSPIAPARPQSSP